MKVPLGVPDAPEVSSFAWDIAREIFTLRPPEGALEVFP